MRVSTLYSLVSACLVSTAVAHSDCTAVDGAVIQHDGFTKGVNETHNGSKSDLSDHDAGEKIKLTIV